MRQQLSHGHIGRLLGPTLLLAAILLPAVPAGALESRLIDYRIELHFGWPLSGKITERVRQLANGVWQVERSGLIFGFTAKEISKFRVVGSDVQSIWYMKEQAGIPNDKRREITFNPTDKGVYDAISLAIKIGMDLRDNPNKETGTYEFASSETRVKEITFNFSRGHELTTEAGKIDTVRVDQLTEADSSRSYWLSPVYDYIIIRAIERDGDGDIKTEINLRNGSIGGKPIKSSS